MKHYIEKANILLEALPYIKKFYEKIFVIKFGGHVMVNEELRAAFVKDVVMFKFIGINPIIVHGGGPQIDEYLIKMGKKPEFVNGLRVTDKETMEIVEMVLVGNINKKIVADVNQMGGRAIGLCGKDGNLILAKPKVFSPVPKIDYGKVGDVLSINSRMLRSLANGKFIPVIAPVGVGENGESYNMNADTVAGAVASAIKAEKLILLTDVEGVKDREGNLLSSLDDSDALTKIEHGIISGGMIPKVQCCLDALRAGVKKTHIIDGRVTHSILLEIFTQKGVGTEIHLNKDAEKRASSEMTLF